MKGGALCVLDDEEDGVSAPGVIRVASGQVAAASASDMKCKNIRTVRGDTQVRCGKCMPCRITITSQWKLRLIYELHDWSSATFLTLNYSDEFFDFMKSQGKDPTSLHKDELSGYLKRLRRLLSYRTDGRKIKFYSCGEYGDLHHRPHYHLILFGVDPYVDDDRDAMKFAWNQKTMIPRNEDFQWDRSRGRKCAIQPVTPDDIGYTCGYVQKKLYGDKAKEEYGDRLAPFALMSKGLGLTYAKKNIETLKKTWTYLPGGARIGVPRYFLDKLDISRRNPLPDQARLDEEWSWMEEKFFEHFPQYEDVDVRIKRSAYMERAWNWFFDKHAWTLADQVWKDFEKRQRLSGGIF